jgi:hypothetical protein
MKIEQAIKDQNNTIKLGDFIKCLDFPFTEYDEVIRIEDGKICTTRSMYRVGYNFLDVRK